MNNLKFESLFDSVLEVFDGKRELSEEFTKTKARWSDFSPKGGAHKTKKDKSRERSELKKSLKRELSSINEGLKNVCWDGYEAIGKKKKSGKEVPNCVPKNKKSVKEGYRVLPKIDTERYTNLEDEGLEGPFRLNSGKIVYYDPKEGRYYDRDSDMYLSHDEYEAHNRPRDFKEAFDRITESRCTGPTKKASSTAKGKKWMQCVKNPDGKGYKRVHWGQKGVRVTGKSGNTKRKKSFRARHNCSNAKAGTAQYQACKDW